MAKESRVRSLKVISVVSKVIYALFLLLTAGILFLALTDVEVNSSFIRHFVIFYLAVMVLALVGILFQFATALRHSIQTNGVGRILLRTAIYLLIGTIIAVVLSYIKYKTFFSLYFAGLPVGFTLVSLFSFSYGDTDKRKSKRKRTINR